MPSGIDETAAIFGGQIDPPVEQRDQRGKAVERAESPEPLFGEREIEGDPETGDTSDGGDDEQLRARERSVADGHDQRPERQRRSNGQDVSRTAEVDDDGIPFEIEQDELAAVGEEGRTDVQLEDEDAEKYEVMVDGATQHVTLAEALRGYIRQATFHQRAQQLNEIQRNLEIDAGRQQQNWGLLIKAKQDYEEDL